MCARWWSPAPRGTLANCCHIQARIMSPTEGSNTEVSRLLCLMVMAARRQPQQMNNNAAPSTDILFECAMKTTTTTQKEFHATSKNMARLIDKLTTELQRPGVLVK